MKFLTTAICCLLILPGCVDNPFEKKRKGTPAEGKSLTGKYFKSEKIGWTITLPRGNEWKFIPPKEQRKINAEGEEMVEELTGTEIEEVIEETLIAFRKDEFNSFMSNLQSFNEAVDGNYDQMLATMHTLVKESYKVKKIKASYELSATRIDGVMIDKFDIRFSSPGQDEFYQHIYTCVIKDHILVMTISADNNTDDETLLKAAFSSKFVFKE